MRLNRKRLEELAGSQTFWVACALVLRLGFVVVLGDRFYQMDEGGYSSLARSLAFWGVYGSEGEPVVGALGAPLFFSLFYRLWDGPELARLGQAILSAATAWGIGRLTLEATGSSRAGLWALAVSAVYPFFIYYSGLLMSETLYLAAVVAGLWALLRSLGDRGKTVRYAAAAGLAFAAAGLTRTEGVPIALVLVGALGGLVAARRYAWKSWLICAVCWAVPLCGWAARNQVHSGKFTLDLHGGMTLLHGTMLYDIDQQDTLYSQQAFELTPMYRKGREMDEAERDRYYRQLALDYMRDNPATTLRHWILKAVSFWRFYPRMDKEYPDNAQARPDVGASRKVLVLISLLFEPALILGGFAGAWRLRERFRTLFPLYWMVLATFGVHVIVVSQMRYRLPIMPCMILFACAWADGSLSRGGRRGSR